MTFTVTSLSRCAGQGHYMASLAFAGGASAIIEFTLDELNAEIPEDREEARREILDRLRSAVKEANAATFAQARAAVLNKTFKV